MWKKVLYIGIAVVIGIFVYIIGYQSNQYNHLTSVVNDAIASSNYSDVAKVFGGCFDTNSIVEDDADDLDLVVYPATSLIDQKYYQGENEVRYLKYEAAYYIYIFKSSFSYSNTTSSSGAVSNETGFVFYSGQNEYHYHFVVSDSVNNTEYVEHPTNPKELVLNNGRDYTNSQSTWYFMTITLTETMLDDIVKELNGNIDSMAIVDSFGEEVYKTNINLDFSQEFFIDLEPLFENYNVYLTDYAKGVAGAEEKFLEFYGVTGGDTGWLNTTFEGYKTTKGYTFRFDDSYLSPSKLVWQTIGMLVLYMLVMALFYILIFHFRSIKRLFTRDNYKNYDDEVIVNGKKVKSSELETETKKSKKSKDESKEALALETEKEPVVVKALPEEQKEEVNEPAKEVKEEAKPAPKKQASKKTKAEKTTSKEEKFTEAEKPTSQPEEKKE